MGRGNDVILELIASVRASCSAEPRKRSWTEFTEFGKFIGLRKLSSAVLPEEWRVWRFMPKNGIRKTRKHYQTLPQPKPSASPKQPALSQKIILSSMILSNSRRSQRRRYSPKKMILLSMILPKWSVERRESSVECHFSVSAFFSAAAHYFFPML